MEKYLMHYKIKYNLKIRKVRFEKKDMITKYTLSFDACSISCDVYSIIL